MGTDFVVHDGYANRRPLGARPRHQLLPRGGAVGPGAAALPLSHCGSTRKPAPGLSGERGCLPPVPGTSPFGLGLRESPWLRLRAVLPHTQGPHSSRDKSGDCPAQTFRGSGATEAAQRRPLPPQEMASTVPEDSSGEGRRDGALAAEWPAKSCSLGSECAFLGEPASQIR